MRDFIQPKSTLGIRQEAPLQDPPLDLVNVITFIWRDFVILFTSSSLYHLFGLSWKRCHPELECNLKYWPPLFDSNRGLMFERFDKQERHGVAPNQISVVSLHMVGVSLPCVDINLFSIFKIVDFSIEIFYFLPGYSIRYSYFKLCVLHKDNCNKMMNIYKLLTSSSFSSFGYLVWEISTQYHLFTSTWGLRLFPIFPASLWTSR